MTYTIRYDQSLADIALMVYGDIRGVFWLLDDNPAQISHMADRLRVGSVLTLRAERVNPRYVAYLAQYPTIATAEVGDFSEGIGAWWLDEYVVAPPDPAVNIAPVATVTASSVNVYVSNTARVTLDPLPANWGWGTDGWNDATENTFPDWLQLQWPQAVSVVGVEVLGLTASLGYTYDPTVSSGYALSQFEIQVWVNNAWVGIQSVSGNNRAYVRRDFSTVITDRLRIYITASVDASWSRIVQLRVSGNL